MRSPVDDSDLNQWLSTTLIFEGLSPSQLRQLSAIAQPQTYRKGELIFQQGTKATGFYGVAVGKVKVFKVSANSKEQILNLFDTGDTFAEVAAMDGLCFPASAAALETTTLFFFPRLAFLALLRQDPDIAVRMLISLAQHSRHLVEVIEDLSFKDVPQRLATYLLKLSDRSSETPQTTVTLDLTKSQLAAALGTIPATLSRAFYRLSTDGLIAIEGARIELLDRDRLQRLSYHATLD